MSTVVIYILAYTIIVFGAVNLVRLTLFAVGSHIYSARKRYENAAELPSFTVVVPAYNEERTIERCLLSLVSCTYAYDRLQIIVADDGSKDSTPAITRAFIQRHPQFDITLLSRKNAGKAHALNYAIEHHAEGELVMCLDADSHIASDALLRAAAYFTDPRVVALSANVKIEETGGVFNLMQVYEYLVNYQIKRALTVFNIEYIIGGIGSVFRRSALEKVGYYDTDTITEDIDLTMKLLRLGNKENRVIYGADVIAYTEAVLSFRDLIRQRFRWKYGRLQTFIKNSDMFFSRDSRHTKWLTWIYLPFILFGEGMFFFEPFMLLFLAVISLIFGDWITVSTACAVMSSFIVLSILAEDTVSFKHKVRLISVAPAMYVFFNVLNMVEYIALLGTYFNIPAVKRSIKKDACGWQPVERMAVVQ